MSTQRQQDEKKSRHRYKGIFWCVVILMVALIAWGIASRLYADRTLRRRTDTESIPNVAIMKAEAEPSTEDIVLPGTVQAFHEATIYARTSGYLKSWTTDIGAHVKAGELLAQIETPEVDAQLHQAEADLATSAANNQLAQSTEKRWRALLKTNAVSKQDADDKIGAAEAAAATMAAAQANLDRLEQLEHFKDVVAPFDGTITARNTDNGALINAGAGGAGQLLFRIAETDRLRIYVEVPESDSAAIKPDLTARLRFAQYPQKDFTANLAHTADAIDPTTRTLLVELWMDNNSGEVLPGGYAEVHLNVPSNTHYVRLPVNTLLFRGDGLHVSTIDEDNKAKLLTVTIGRDYGKDVEITSGVTAGQTIMVNPPDSLFDGELVKPIDPEAKKDDKKSTGGMDGKDDGSKETSNKKKNGKYDAKTGDVVKGGEGSLKDSPKKDDKDDSAATASQQEPDKGPDVDTRGNKKDDTNQ